MMKCKENRLKGLETILCKMRSKNIKRMKWFKSWGVTIYFVLCRHATLLYWRGALRDVTKNGCVADYFVRRYWENAFEGKNLMFLQGWRIGIRLPPTLPGFQSWRRRRHMWVEFVVVSLTCSEKFFSRYSSLLKSQHFQIQFHLERTDTFQRVLKNR